MLKFSIASAGFGLTQAAFFTEDFSGDWSSRWTTSSSKDDLGEFKASAGKYYNDAEVDVGIQTSQDAKFYAVSRGFDKFSNEGKTIYIQFRVKFEQTIDCGGGYLKIFPSTLDGEKMEGESPYNIMFGPDICGYSTKKVHVIFGYKGKNLLTKKEIACKSDEVSHLYTLTINPDNTYQVDIDGEKEHSGSLYDDFDFLLPKMINDPAISKPEDWVDETMIDDPEDKKPEDWVDVKQIADPDAEKPEDWDDEMDGEWEAPMIDNPEYKGEWSPKRIDNPAYKGEWEHPQIANPDFVDDPLVYKFDDFGAVGVDVWQVKSGTIFDDIIITDDKAEIDAAVAAFKTLAEGEKTMKEAAEKKAADEAAAAAEAEKEDEEPEADAEAKDEL